MPILLVLPATARLFVVQEEPEEAVELWAQATTYPMIANSAMLEKLAGQYVRPVFDLLPQAIVDVAKERSRQRDLYGTAEAILTRFAS